MADPAVLFDLSVKDADRVETLRDFFHEAGREFILDDVVPDGAISVHAADLEFREALALLLPESYGVAEDQDGVFHIRHSA